MNILVTAGPTREHLDDVRFLSNAATGKMGLAVARAARDRGHDVTLVLGPTAEPADDLQPVRVVSAADMLAAVERLLPACDALVMTAAVADWRPAVRHPGKCKKTRTDPVLALERTADILLTVRPLKAARLFVGFAAETAAVEEEGRRKLVEKGLDLVVANDLSRPDSGFGTDTNRAVLIEPGGACTRLPTLTKRELGERIVDWLEARAATGSSRRPR